MIVEIHDAIFGHLKSDEEFPYYFPSTIRFSDIEMVQFTLNFETNPQVLSASSSDELSAVISRAHELYDSLRIHDVVLRRKLAIHHLALEYDWWNTSEEPVEVEAFVSAMTLYGIFVRVGEDEISSTYVVQLDYHVHHPFGTHYLYAAINALMEVTDTEFRM